MRRILLTALAVATVATTASALAAAPSTARHVVKPYSVATTATNGASEIRGSGLILGGTPAEGEYGFTFIKLRQTDQRANIRLADRTGRTVQALIQQVAKDGSLVEIGIVCGKSAKSLDLAPGGGRLVVRPSYGMCGQAPSVPTTGKVFATLR
jgi:hypothetical protein